MDKKFCRLIDQQLLVEQYVAGKLKGDLLNQFEIHIRECEVHAQAVTLEKAFKRGASNFARSEIKTQLRQHIEKRRETRFMMLRYAAVLLVAVITPLLLYYQYEMSSSDLITRMPEQPITKSPAASPPEIETTATEEPDETQPGGGNETEAIIQPVKTLSGKNETAHTEAVSEMEQMSHKQVAAPSSRAGRAKGLAISDKSDVADTPIQGAQMEVLTTYLKTAHDTLKQCVDDILPAPQRESYQIRFSIFISGKGKVSKIEIAARQVESPVLENCLTEQIRSWEFLKDYPPVTLEATWNYAASQ